MAAFRSRAGQFVLAIALASTLPAAETAPPPRPVSGNPSGHPRGEALLFETNANLLRIATDNWWSVSVSPDGKWCATGLGLADGSGEVRIWDRATGKVKHVIPEPKAVRAVAYSPDGSMLATGNYDSSIRFYDASFTLIGVSNPEKRHTSGVNGICFFNKGRYLASAGLDNASRIWDLSALKKKTDGRAVVEPVAIFEGHTQGVLSVSVSADGRTLLSGSLDKSARCYDVPDLPAAGFPPAVVKKERVLLGGHNAAVEAVAVSPDGKLLATGSWDARVLIRDRDGKNETSLRFNLGVMSMAFSADGKQLAIGTGNTPVPEQAGELRVWDVAEKKQAATSNYPSSVLSVSFVADGKTIASVGQDRALHLWPFAEKKERLTHSGGGSGFTPLPYLAGTLSPSGDLLALAGDGKSAFILDRRNSTFVAELKGHEDVIACLAFSPDGQTLATASHDKTITLWNTATWAKRKTLSGHGGPVLGVAFSPDSRTLASGSYDKTVRFWNSESGEPAGLWKEHGAGVRTLAFSPDGARLASAGSDRTVRITKVADGSVVHVLKGHKAAVRAVSFSPDGRFIASGSEDRTVKVWDAAAGKETNAFPNLPDLVSSLQFSPKGQTLAAGTFQGPVVILDPLSGRTRQTLRSHGEPVSAVMFSDGGVNLISVSHDRTIRQTAILKDATAPPVQALTAKIGLATAVAFTPDGRTAVVGNGVGDIVVWNWKGDEIRIHPGHPGGVAGLAISDERRIASIGKDDTLRVGTGKEPEWIGKGRFAVFAPDGKKIAVAEDKDIVLRNAANGSEIKRLTGGHDGNVARLAFSPDGRRLLSAGDDTKVRLWNMETGAKIQDAPVFGNYSSVTQLAFSPDGSRFAAAAYGPDQPPPDDMTGNFRLVREVRVFTVPTGEGPLAAPVVFVPQPNDQQITGLEWTGDGQSLVMPAMDGTIRVTELAAGGPRETQRFRAHDSAVMAAASSLETGVIITAGEDLAIRRWRMPGADPLPGQARVTPAGLTRFWQMLPSPDAKYFVAAGEGDKTFRVYSALPSPLPVEPDRHGSIYSLAFSPDNRFLVTGHDTGAVVVRDAQSGKPLRTLAGMKKRAMSVGFAEGGKTVIAVGGNVMNGEEPGEGFIWEFASGAVRHKLDIPGLHWMAAVHPKGKSIAAAGNDGTLRIWDVASGKLVKQLAPEVPRGLYTVAYDASGDRIATGVHGGRFRIWNVAEETVIREIRTNPDLRPSQALFSPDGKEIVVSLWRGNGPERKPEIAAYSIADRNAAPRTFAAHPASVMNIAFLPDGKTLVAAGGENNGVGSLRAFDFATGKALGQFTGHRNWVQSLTVSTDGKVASTSWGTPLNGELKLWDARGLQPIAEMKVPGETQYVSCASISRDGKLLILGGWGQTLTAWDMSNPAKPVLRKQSKEHTAPLRSVAFDPDGSRLVSADESGMVKVWDASSLEMIVSFKASENAVYRAKFTPDGTAVVTVGGRYQTKAKGEIQVWNPKDGKLVGRFPEQSREVWDIVFLNDGKGMAAIHTPNGAAGDANIKIWDFERREVTRTLLPPGTFPGGRCLGLSADGGRLAIGSGSGPVKVFDTTTWHETLNLPELSNCTFGVSFSRDAKTLLIASGEGAGITVRVQ